MHSPIVFAKKLAARISLPPQLQPGLLTVELSGRNSVLISRHRGLTEFTAQRISAASKEGTVTVLGRDLNITQMNRDYLTVSGRISGVTFTEE